MAHITYIAYIAYITILLLDAKVTPCPYIGYIIYSIWAYVVSLTHVAYTGYPVGGSQFNTLPRGSQFNTLAAEAKLTLYLDGSQFNTL